MLDLTFRSEFRGRILKRTVIELRNNRSTGAIQKNTKEFLDIVCPSTKLLRFVEAIQPDKKRIILLKGGSGQGKSHMMATAYHLLNEHTVRFSSSLRKCFEDGTATVTRPLHPPSHAVWSRSASTPSPDLQDEFDDLARQRARHLVDKRNFSAVEPVLPMDTLGHYVLLPTSGKP